MICLMNINIAVTSEESAYFERESAGATLHRRFENLTDSRTTRRLIKLGQIV